MDAPGGFFGPTCPAPLKLTATIGPGLMPPPENDDDRPEGRSLMFGIAGERFAPNGNLAVSVERTFPGWPGSWRR
jgi:hypothetical protein